MQDTLTLETRSKADARLAYGRPQPAARFGPTLTLWVILTVLLQGALWLSGWRSLALAEAVEQGAAVVESRKFGEEPESTTRRSIRNQRDTLPFWTALTLIGDFAFEPAGLLLRSVVVATAFSALAALTGRPVRFGEALTACAAAQGFWVLGSTVRLALTVATRNPEVTTSLALFFPPGTYRAPLWVMAGQVEAFALIGWFVLARGGWRRGEVNPAMALLVCLPLWATEAAARTVWTLTVESGMRMLLIPEWIAK